jgi:oligopeptide/dipeptide ABC transporter ATP-binding protein
MQLESARSKPPRRLATEIGVVFQDPASCFNPARRIGPQITEVARVHGNMTRAEANEAAVERLRECRVSAPESRMRQYPHELSGGMRQRAMIAAALLTSPTLIIADEPTTALDVTVQAEVLDLLRSINATLHTSILLISHDIKVISTMCDRICVMYAGGIVEELSASALRQQHVCHPYTRALLMAAPELRPEAKRLSLNPLPGRTPSPGQRGVGCAFAPRCSLAGPHCSEVAPVIRDLQGDGRAACHVTQGPLEMARATHE